MFSALTISIIIGIGAGTWVYSKVMRSTGNNTKSSLIVGGITGLIIIIALTILLDVVLKKK
ncbi:MAG TPA: hypothetical protein VMR34_01775 [Candidatus Saccharimonadales bacterium]|nr:hypothetical protein [Candidatus Saccharimonadales bacterium]